MPAAMPAPVPASVSAGAPTQPLLAPRAMAAPLVWCAGRAVSAGQFIAQAQALAARLPPTGLPINLCQDRYRFALGLAAALLRGHTSLMPPNALPETLRALHHGTAPGSPAAYALTDDAHGPELGGLPRVVVQPSEVPLPDATEVPQLAVGLEAVRLLTSGSTGAPQAHAKCWGDLVTNIAAEAARLAEHLGTPDLQGLSIVATVPAQHSYGFESTVLLALLGGAMFDAGRPFYPADVTQALASVPAPRALVSTPFHLKTLLLSGVALPPTALTLSATAPLSPQLAAQAEAALQGPLIEIYGCTEAGQVASRRTTAGDVWTTLGSLQITAVESRHNGQSEQFFVSGGHVGEPTLLADVLALLDARRFRLLGRANDLIHVAGKRSSLAHLNFHLNRIDGVQDGAFWLPDEHDGAVVRPVAFVVAPDLSAAQVTAGLRERLEPVFVPRRVVHVAALPREATGKLTVAALRGLALQHIQPRAAVRPDGSALCVWPIAPEHPAFAGHFPGRPILPGVVLLSLVMETLAQAPALQARLGPQPHIDSVKFLSPVGPGSDVQVSLRAQGSGVAFELHCGPQAVARGQLRPGPAA